MTMLHLWISSIRHFTNYSCIFHNQQCQHRRIYNTTKMVSELDWTLWGFSNAVLEGLCPAEFSSNPDQTHLPGTF